MATKQPDLQEKKEKKQPTEYDNVHNKSFDELKKEARNPKPEGESESSQGDDTSKQKGDLEEKAKEVTEKREQKEKEDIAEKAARAAREAVQEENRRLQEEREKREKEEKDKLDLEEKKKPRTPKWTAVGEDGKPRPASYEEVFNEAKEAAKEEIRIELEEQRRQQEAERAQREQQDNEAKKQEEEARKAEEERINNRLTSELTDLRSLGRMPKVEDEKNPNDPGKLAETALYEQAVKVNQERMAKGLPPIVSLKEIYYEHYKAPKQPAGGDAPVMGNRPAAENDGTKFNYFRDIRNKSFKDIVADAKKKLTS